VSPKGDIVAFITGGQAWSVPLAGGEAKPLFYARGSTRELRWSPDGSKLAFVSDRGDHSFIGVYTGTSSALRFLAPRPSRISRFGWSPDGGRIAFIRYPIPGGPPQSMLHEAQPWQHHDRRRGAASRTRWAEPVHDRGSFPTWQVTRTRMGRGRPDRLSTSWTGGRTSTRCPRPAASRYSHPRQVHGGARDREPDHRFIVFSANTGPDANDDDRRHIFRVPVDSRGHHPDPGRRREWAPVITGDNNTSVRQRHHVAAAGARGAGLLRAAPPTLVGAD
jgi:dipeptidyl aminopeptidase/acylaminoacyl peptidase